MNNTEIQDIPKTTNYQPVFDFGEPETERVIPGEPACEKWDWLKDFDF